MTIGPSWTKDLAKHDLEYDGESSLLIIDEYIKEIPF